MMNSHFEPLGKVRTKIVATVGPASRDPAMLRKLVEAGVDVFRLNFSHGTHDEHSATLAAIRTIGEEMGRQLAVLQDLCGPKIRLGPIAGDVIECDYGAEFCLAAEAKECHGRAPPHLHVQVAARRPGGRPDRALRRRHRRHGRHRATARAGPR